MNKRIETLEELDLQLGDPYFDMTRRGAKTDIELLGWMLLANIAFDPDVLIKGSRAEEVPEHLPDDYPERQWERFGDLYTVDNQPLREWLTTTNLEHIAAYTGYLVRRSEVNKVSGYYDAAQDFYADHWHEFDEFTRGEISGREFISSLYEQVDEVNAHIAEGKALGLTMDEIVLHDAMWGLLPRAFDPELTAIARETLQEAVHQLPSRPYIWSESGKRVYAPNMLKYTALKMEKAGFDIGLGQGYTTEQGYLLDYFSRLYWREAAARPED